MHGHMLSFDKSEGLRVSPNVGTENQKGNGKLHAIVVIVVLSYQIYPTVGYRYGNLEGNDLILVWSIRNVRINSQTSFSAFDPSHAQPS